MVKADPPQLDWSKFIWGINMPSGNFTSAILDQITVSWSGGTLNSIIWEGGPTTLYGGTTSTSPLVLNTTPLPFTYSWNGRINLVFLFSGKLQNNRRIDVSANYRGCIPITSYIIP